MNRNFKLPLALLGVALALALPGAAQTQDPPPADGKTPAPRLSSLRVSAAMAVLNPTDGNAASGTVKLTQAGDGARVVAKLSGLSPGAHGLAILDQTHCPAAGGATATHSDAVEKSLPGAALASRGEWDLGNVTADASGKARLDRVFGFLTLSGTNSIVGHALVIEAKPAAPAPPDSGRRRASAAGAPVACGVIVAQRQ